MHFDINLNTFLEALALAGIIGIFKMIFSINGSVGRMQTWREAHEKQDDERHEHIEKQQASLWKKIDDLQRA